MSRKRWEQVLFANVHDEVAQDALNGVMLEVEAENDKLRELVKRLVGHVEHPPCEGCSADMNCDCSDLTRCDEWSMMVYDAREFGIEV